MDTFLTIFIVICAILCIAGFAMTLSQSKRKNEIQRKLQEISGFEPEKTLIKTGLTMPIPKGLSIDSKSQQVCLIIGDKLSIIPFSNIIESEIVIDGQTVTKTARGSQVVGIAVGAVLGGGLGAVIGGLSGPTITSQNVKNVFLRLILNDLEYSVHDIEFVELTNTGSTLPVIALKEAEEWNNILKVVIFQGK